MLRRKRSQVLSGIALFGLTKIPHALLGMGSGAFVASVALPRQSDSNFLPGINEVQKRREEKKMLCTSVRFAPVPTHMSALMGSHTGATNMRLLTGACVSVVQM